MTDTFSAKLLLVDNVLMERFYHFRLNRCSTFESSFDTSHLSGLAESQRDVETITSSEILKSHSLKWWEKYIGFYTAPITKFWGNVVS